MVARGTTTLSGTQPNIRTINLHRAEIGEINAEATRISLNVYSLYVLIRQKHTPLPGLNMPYLSLSRINMFVVYRSTSSQQVFL